MREICRQTANVVKKSNPEFKSSSPDALLGWWWGIWIGYNILAQITSRMQSGAHGNVELLNATEASFFSITADLIAAVLLLMIIKRLMPFEKELANKKREIRADLLIVKAPAPVVEKTIQPLGRESTENHGENS